MITLSQFSEDIGLLYEETSSNLDRCVAFLEASWLEFENNLKEAKLKVITENGTPDDMIYLENEANEGLIAKGKKTAVAMIEAIKKFVRDLVDKVKSFFEQKEVQDGLKKAEAASKNPAVANVKIKLPDIDKFGNIWDEFDGKARKFIAKVQSGNADDKDIEEFNKAAKDRSEKMDAAKKASKTVGVAAAIAFAKKCYDKVSSDSKSIDSLTKSVNTDPKNPHFISLDALEKLSSACKDHLRDVSDALHECISAVGHVFKGDSKLDLNEESVNDSTNTETEVETEENVFAAESAEDEVTLESIEAYLDAKMETSEENPEDVVDDDETTEDGDDTEESVNVSDEIDSMLSMLSE